MNEVVTASCLLQRIGPESRYTFANDLSAEPPPSLRERVTVESSGEGGPEVGASVRLRRQKGRRTPERLSDPQWIRAASSETPKTLETSPIRLRLSRWS